MHYWPLWDSSPHTRQGRSTFNPGPVATVQVSSVCGTHMVHAGVDVTTHANLLIHPELMSGCGVSVQRPIMEYCGVS